MIQIQDPKLRHFLLSMKPWMYKDNRTVSLMLQRYYRQQKQKTAYERWTQKKKKRYIEKHCFYPFRSDLRISQKPTEREWYQFLKKTNQVWEPILDRKRILSTHYCIPASSRIQYRGKTKSRARLVYIWFRGDIPHGARVVKRCHSKNTCLRPEHLGLSITPTHPYNLSCLLDWSHSCTHYYHGNDDD